MELHSFSVEPELIRLRLSTIFVFDESASEPILEVSIRGEFAEATFVRVLASATREELDEISFTDTEAVLTGPFMQEVVIPGSANWRRAEYQVSDYAEAVADLRSENERLHGQLREARNRLGSLKSFVESLVARRSIDHQAGLLPAINTRLGYACEGARPATAHVPSA